ncbi:MAG TPA: hypothetical protein VL549_08800 [Gemmatimonadales bacterium]|jgi:hypothetical protein|nr:hypothetical protein [Gemmatimonadales bacterium]
MDLSRLKRWLHRYGPAELTGITTALLGSYGVHALTGNEVAAAFGGALGETIGFYGVIVTREVRSDAAAARAAGARYGPRAWLRTVTNLLMEFGGAEVLDSAVIRPLAMGFGTRLLGRPLGIPLGKLAADITFYVPVIFVYEWRRRHAITPRVPRHSVGHYSLK